MSQKNTNRSYGSNGGNKKIFYFDHLVNFFQFLLVGSKSSTLFGEQGEGAEWTQVAYSSIKGEPEACIFVAR
jgi:hypothetical protein